MGFRVVVAIISLSLAAVSLAKDDYGEIANYFEPTIRGVLGDEISDIDPYFLEQRVFSGQLQISVKQLEAFRRWAKEGKYQVTSVLAEHGVEQGQVLLKVELHSLQGEKSHTLKLYYQHDLTIQDLNDRIK